MSEPLKRPASPETALAKKPRLPKRKVAILIGYCGTGYHGMQVNPPHKTIEGDLFKALVEAGAISADNADDPKKSSLIRAARTDKGVHAAGNVVSLKMICGDEDKFDEMVTKINEYLPPQIRVWSFSRTNRAFECRKVCSSRVYEYVLPTYTLLSPRSRTPLGKAIAQSSVAKSSPEAEEFWERVDAAVDASLASEDLERASLDLPDDDADGIRARRTARAAENAARRTYRVSSERLDQLREVLQQYRGTHNFHNFTVGKNPSEASAKRVMRTLEVGKPFLVDGTEWVSIKIHGQSFMLHQIRKMIATAVLIVRCGAPAAKIRELFAKAKVAIPKAPALGLLLEQPVYDAYNERLGRLGRNAISFDAYKDKIEAFKHEFIYDRIYAQEAADNEFHAFFGFLDTYSAADLPNFLLGVSLSGNDPKSSDETVAVIADDIDDGEDELATEDNEG